MFRDKNTMHNKKEIDLLILEELVKEQELVKKLEKKFEDTLEKFAEKWIQKKIDQLGNKTEQEVKKLTKRVERGDFNQEIKNQLNKTEGTSKLIKDATLSTLVITTADVLGLDPNSFLIRWIAQTAGEITPKDLEKLQTGKTDACNLIVNKLFDGVVEGAAVYIMNILADITSAGIGKKASHAAGVLSPRIPHIAALYGPATLGVGKQQIANMIRGSAFIQKKKTEAVKALCGLDVGLDGAVKKVTNYISGKAAPAKAAPKTKAKGKKTYWQRASQYKGKEKKPPQKTKKTYWQRASQYKGK